MKIREKLKNFQIKEKLLSAKDKAMTCIRRIGAKNMIIACAVLVCGVAIMLNFILAGTKPKNNSGYKIDPDYYAALLNAKDTTNETSTPDDGKDGDKDAAAARDEYFDTAAYNRDRARDEAIEVLSSVVENETALDEVRNQAGDDIAALAANISAESNIEELIKAKGFEDCVAIINGDSISVIVKTDGLLPNEVAQITEIVYEQSGILPANMNIVEK